MPFLLYFDGNVGEYSDAFFNTIESCEARVRRRWRATRRPLGPFGPWANGRGYSERTCGPRAWMLSSCSDPGEQVPSRRHAEHIFSRRKFALSGVALGCSSIWSGGQTSLPG